MSRTQLHHVFASNFIFFLSYLSFFFGRSYSAIASLFTTMYAEYLDVSQTAQIETKLILSEEDWGDRTGRENYSNRLKHPGRAV